MVVDEEVGEELFLMSILDSLDTPDSSIVRSRLRPFLRSHTAALSRDQPGTSGRDGEIWKFETKKKLLQNKCFSHSQVTVPRCGLA